MLIATGQAALPEITSASGELFAKLKPGGAGGVHEVAQAIVRDGEGATKFVTVQVNSGRQSPGVPGRGLCRGPLAADQDRAVRLRPQLGAHPFPPLAARRAEPGRQPDRRVPRRSLYRQPGWPRAATPHRAQGAAVMAREEISIRIELGW